MKEHHRRVIGYEKSCPLELEIERLEATILSLTDEKSKVGVLASVSLLISIWISSLNLMKTKILQCRQI